MKFVVGLGNPGRKYQGTRHNIGFDVLQEMAKRHQAGPSSVAHESEVREIHVSGEKVLLVAPLTYMNLSGIAVASLLRFYKADPSQVLIVCDDLNLPVGQLRLRATGSSGGQKGVKDIIAKLGTEDVARLRFGIGRPSGRIEISNYVLQKFAATEEEEIKIAIQYAADGVECWLQEEVEKAMSLVNSRRVDAD